MSAGAPPPPASRGIPAYTWLVGVAVVLGLAYVTLNAARTEGPGARGIAAGSRLPPFAAPLAASDLEGDANVAARAACEVRGAAVLNVCALGDRRPLVLAFVAPRPARCLDQLDVLDRVAADTPGVAFAAVVVRGEREAARRAVRRRGWRIPVGHDRDGAVSNLYGIGVCPTIVFAARGRVARATTYGFLDERELRRRVRALR